MLELRRVVFFVDIGDNLLEKAKASQECREECKNLFIAWDSRWIPITEKKTQISILN